MKRSDGKWHNKGQGNGGLCNRSQRMVKMCLEEKERHLGVEEGYKTKVELLGVRALSGGVSIHEAHLKGR